MTQPPEWEAPGVSGGPNPSSPEGGRPHQQPVPDSPPNPSGQPNPYGPPAGQPNPYAQPAGQGYPYGHPGQPEPPGPPLPQQRSGLSITSFVLGLVGCLPLVGLAAVVVGIVALVKKQALKGLAITGIILGALWTLGGIAFWAVGMPERISDAVSEAVESAAADLEESTNDPFAEDPAGDSAGDSVDHWAVPGGLTVGDCLNDPAASLDGEGQLADSIEVVPCDEPHDLEAYVVRTLPEGDFPGDEAIEELAAQTCLDAFEDFIGAPYEVSEFEIYYYYPFEDTWNYADDRSISCTVGSLTGRTTGSAEGANR